MVMEDLRIDELILQVFEEHEDTFFWPVSSQKEAKNFVKFLHDKGAPYEDLCKEIGEFEHNFNAWRKGLGRVGIGTRMIERINRTVEEVIESDDEEEAEHNLRLLAKVNQKNAAKTNDKVKPISKEVKDSKQQKQDITSSIMKNIDKVTEKITETAKEKEVIKTTTVKEPEPPRKEIVKKEPEPVKHQERQVPKNKPLPEKVEVVQVAAKVESKPVEEKPKVAVELKKEPVKPEPVKPDPVKESKNEDIGEEKEDESKKEDPEVDEVKKKMDAIRKKVEMMKKAKAEQAAAGQQQYSAKAGEAASSRGGNEAGEKYEAMKKKLSELRTKLMEDDSAAVSSTSVKQEPGMNPLVP